MTLLSLLSLGCMTLALLLTLVRLVRGPSGFDRLLEPAQPLLAPRGVVSAGAGAWPAA